MPKGECNWLNCTNEAWTCAFIGNSFSVTILRHLGCITSNINSANRLCRKKSNVIKKKAIVCTRVDTTEKRILPFT